jgi:chromate transporter
MTSAGPDRRLRELAGLFLKLGFISFGGPAAHIALMRHEVVERRRWLTNEEFLDLVGATNLIPGPNSTEMAIHIGHLRGGRAGLIVAGACFILPAAIIVGAVAALYVRVGTLPQTQALFYGINPVVIAIVVVALWQLAGSALRTTRHVLLAIGAAAAVVAGFHELIVLALGALLGGLTAFRKGTGGSSVRRLGVWMMTVALANRRAATDVVAAQGLVAAVAPAAAAASAVSLATLCAVFFKAGALLFGSGYVLLAFLRADLVERLGWLTEHELLDAIAVGQLTPGPVFTTATFVGYVLAGPAGSILATIAIFLPAFVYVALSGPIVPRLRRSRVAGAVLDGVNAASLALMAVVCWQLGRASVVDATTGLIAAASVVAMLSWRVNPLWLILVGAVTGLAARGL